MPKNPEYWRRKLSALLHDSPDKAIDILGHENRAKILQQTDAFEPNEKARKQADFAASAADRLPWPKPKFCRTELDLTDTALKHPLGKACIDFARPFPTADAAFEISHKSRPQLAVDDPRATFLATWRFWQNWASAADERLTCLPAETRLPDHTIWNHLTATSALQGCFGGSFEPWIPGTQPADAPDQPAFLLFSIGPVQDFIASARNTRDLWSGSYLLSCLVGTVLTKIALDFGPDHVIFPNLNNQPIVDLLLKDDLWSTMKTASGGDLWEALRYDRPKDLKPNHRWDGRKRLLTPSLPNRFLAILPADMTEHPRWNGPDDNGRSGAARYAADLENTVRAKLKEIAESVREHCKANTDTEFDCDRFDKQIDRLLEVHWQILAWPKTVDDALDVAKIVPRTDDDDHPLNPIQSVLDMISRMPPEHRDSRYFRHRKVEKDGQPGKLEQVASAWSALFAALSWQHDAVKTARSFSAWSTGGWETGRAQNKDSLNGKEEAVLTVPNGEEAERFSEKLADGNPLLFKAGDLLGASTLVKRLWHLTWLAPKHGFQVKDFGMPNTRSMAAHRPDENNADDESESDEKQKYFAVLALDGDEMGKWISGIKAPEIGDQLSKEAREYFEKHGNADFLKARRPLSPSFHLQFSELLANFGLHCARRIVEAFDGSLIYSGGDDVLAMLPADTALRCARALRAAFRGEKELPELAKQRDSGEPLFTVEHEGFVKLTEFAAPNRFGSDAGLLDDPVNFPFMVPGPATDCSAGIAIAHYKSPLQDVVRAAQEAEKRAKRDLKSGGLGRGAVAVTLMKRSGETIEWGTRWDSGGFDAFQAVLDGLKNDFVSHKFPHRIVELITPYQAAPNGDSDAPAFAAGFADAVDGILDRDIQIAEQRQKGKNPDQEKAAEIREKLLTYVRKLETSQKVSHLIGLCQTAAFIARNLPNA